MRLEVTRKLIKLFPVMGYRNSGKSNSLGQSSLETDRWDAKVQHGERLGEVGVGLQGRFEAVAVMASRPHWSELREMQYVFI